MAARLTLPSVFVVVVAGAASASCSGPTNAPPDVEDVAHVDAAVDGATGDAALDAPVEEDQCTTFYMEDGAPIRLPDGAIYTVC